MFVDRVRVKLEAGNGGDGAMSFRHEKFRPKGGPDGGDGGNGGSIVLKASRNQNTLAAFRYQKLLKAENGQPGGKAKKHGRNGQDLLVAVPVGTMVTTGGGDIVADLVADDQEAIIARGGRGGYGNAHFVSSTRQAPRVAEKGERGDRLEVDLELKMIADVGIVGLPNAGKSTLLSVISNAKPEIANYPFTTLSPNLGVVDVDKKHSLLFADIPGLIEGASQGKGLGDEFLRHVERTSVLVHLVDAFSEDVAEAYRTVMAELAAYQVDLSGRPQIVALTKVEGMDPKLLAAKLAELKQVLPPATPLLALSSAAKQGLDELLRLVQKAVEKVAKQRTAKTTESELPVIGVSPDDNDWQVRKSKNGFLVTGQKIERFAARTRFGDYHAEQRLRDVMLKMGIMRELERQGIEAGQQIQIGVNDLGRLEY